VETEAVPDTLAEKDALAETEENSENVLIGVDEAGGEAEPAALTDAVGLAIPVELSILLIDADAEGDAEELSEELPVEVREPETDPLPEYV
jgi:hypothetical protein